MRRVRSHTQALPQTEGTKFSPAPWGRKPSSFTSLKQLTLFQAPASLAGWKFKLSCVWGACPFPGVGQESSGLVQSRTFGARPWGLGPRLVAALGQARGVSCWRTGVSADAPSPCLSPGLGSLCPRGFCHGPRPLRAPCCLCAPAPSVTRTSLDTLS